MTVTSRPSNPSEDSQANFGWLEPVPSGDSIPLTKKKLRIGRRQGCDIILEFANVSSHHAIMDLENGYWFVKDLNSRNGIKVNGARIDSGLRKRMDPNSQLFIAKNEFILRYDPESLGNDGNVPEDESPPFDFGDKSGAARGIRPWDEPGKPGPLGGSADFES